jgi:hypothetical protein|tara:strand:- start:77 stop:1417 length:1341 start_codon:yes stop_codon:yes gene_type:complete
MSKIDFARRLLEGAVDFAGKKIGALSNITSPPPAPLSMYDAPAGFKPEYRGAAPDRSDLTYLRYKPAKGYSDRVNSSLEALRDPDNPIRAELLKDIRRGEEIGGNDWYNTEELRDWFVTELGEAQGDAEWREFLYLMGTTSPGSNVPMNIASASATRGRFFTDPDYVDALLNAESLKDAQEIAKARPKGYGHKTAGLQEMNTAKLLRGQYGALPEPNVSAGKSSWTEQPKPKGFANSLLGNRRNIAADLHFTRYMAMASKHPDWLNTGTDVGYDFMENVINTFPEAEKYFSIRKFKSGKVEKEIPSFNFKKAAKEGAIDLNIAIDDTGKTIADVPQAWAQMPNANEYGAFEDFINELASELGQTPAQVQANMWMGGADRTGVAEESQGTFMELIRERAKKKAIKDNTTPNQVLQNFIRNGGFLSLIGGTGLGALNNIAEETKSEAQ